MPSIKYYFIKKTFDILKMGNNIGITHSESRAMMKVFIDTKPETLKEMDLNTCIDKYVRCKGWSKMENFYQIIY